MARLIRPSRRLLSGQHLYLGNYRDFSHFEFSAPPRLQHVIPPVDAHPGVTAPNSSPSVYHHMPDPLAFLNGELTYPQITADDLTPKGKVLRGSGLHGPERRDVLRLVLYNRLKVRQFQRLVPSAKESREDHKVVISSVWFTLSSMVALGLMFHFGMDYGLVHEHYPWTPERVDGTRGPGPMYWYTL